MFYSLFLSFRLAMLILSCMYVFLTRHGPSFHGCRVNSVSWNLYWGALQTPGIIFNGSRYLPIVRGELTFAVTMHNKLPSNLARHIYKLKYATSFHTLIIHEIIPRQSPQCDNTEIRICPVDFAGNLSNLVSRNFASCCSFSQMDKPKIVDTENVFRLSDYDCIGFDLDNTISRYKLNAMVKLEYDVLSQFLVNVKGYDSQHLYAPFENRVDFLQKGLFLDFAHGNVLQIDSNGYVMKACHGTKLLGEQEIVTTYGKDRQWTVAAEFTRNMLEAWNGPLSEKIRTVLDYFDMPATLAFARIIDSLEAKGMQKNIPKVWPDVLDGLIEMFKREHFSADKGGYFPSLKANPEEYIYKCSDNVLNWLKKIKSEKITFLITGSNVDFASFVASNAIGKDWKDLFDVIVCYARKPGFFLGGRPFLSLQGSIEDDALKSNKLRSGEVYSQGNWQDLYGLLSRISKRQKPKCVYIGDNLIQDVYTPSEYTVCDTVAVVEEMIAEGMVDCNGTHKDKHILVSNTWGSYFSSVNNNHSNEISLRYSLWTDIIRNHSKICIPNLEVLSLNPLNHGYPEFMNNEQNICTQSGYYPNCPVTLQI